MRQRTGFGPPIEFTVVPLVCVAALAQALPSIITRHSPVAIVVGAVSALVLAGLAGWNLYATRHERASFDNFHVPTFVLVLVLGIAWGATHGGVLRAAVWGVAGCAAGIGAGLYQQKLGTLAFLVRWAANIGVACAAAWIAVYFFVSFLI